MKVLNIAEYWTKVKNKLTTRHGLLGDYDYAHLFTPNIPFLTKNGDKIQPFFGLDSEMPIFLGMLLGLQHALSMLAGVITPPLIIGAAANLGDDLVQYLVSASLIASGLLTIIQITRFHIKGTKYYLGTGLLSVGGTSFATITIVNSAFPKMYATGFCPTAADGTKLPCPDGYGAILGTGCVCALIEILLSFLPPKMLQRAFGPIITGPVVLMIGVNLIQSGFEDFLGGAGCMSSEFCPSATAPHPLEWGSGQFIGLGFLVIATIILSEKFGSPIMKSCAVIIGLLAGCIVAAACNYFDRSSIDAAPSGNFLWVHTFKLTVYGPIVLPMLATYVVLMMEAIGDITATCDVSRLEVSGELYESRIQGGVLADGLNGMLACLMTITPISTFAQNNGVISITKCANRAAGYWCCFWLILMGIVAKFAAALVAIPKAVLGGMTTFLFTSVTVAGIAIIGRTSFTRRDRFILTCSLLFGFGATLIPTWFNKVFTYKGDNDSLEGFLTAIELVLESGFSVCALVGMIVNAILPAESPEELTQEVLEAEHDPDAESYELHEHGSSSKQAEINFTTTQKSDIEITQ